jgi:hypothetical protein
MRAGGQGLANLAAAVGELGRPPRAGRPPNIDAIHRASIVLMSAHLEGYIEDVYEEAANILLAGKVRDLGALVADAQFWFQNPKARKVESLFRTIGLSKILDGVSWRRSNNKSVRKRLDGFVDLRNDIAHGNEPTVRKRTVIYYEQFTLLLARNLDNKVSTEIQSLTGQSPW